MGDFFWTNREGTSKFSGDLEGDIYGVEDGDGEEDRDDEGSREGETEIAEGR